LKILNKKKKKLIRKINKKKIDSNINKIINRDTNQIKELNRIIKYNTINKELKINKIIDENGNEVLDNNEGIEVMARGYNRILETEDHNNEYLEGESDEREINTDDNEITLDEFNKALKNLKGNTSPGISKITGNIIKAIKHYHPTILKVFQIFYKNSIILDHWRESLIKLIYKEKGDTGDFNNYRPISLLDCIYKLFSNIINNKIQKHFYYNNKLLNSQQFGFLPEHSIS
jgi:hypothetical protein